MHGRLEAAAQDQLAAAAASDAAAANAAVDLAALRVANAREDREAYREAGYWQYISASIATAHGAKEDWHGSEIRELARDIERGSWKATPASWPPPRPCSAVRSPTSTSWAACRTRSRR